MNIQIDRDRCCGDGACVRVCPSVDFVLDDEGKAVLDASKPFVCIECGHCAAVCPTGAITLEGAPAEDAPLTPSIPEGALETLMKTRRSIRWYADRPVERAVLERALDVARYAPTGVNSQRISWIALDDPAILRKVAELTVDFFEKDPTRKRTVAIARTGYDYILRGAPCLVLAQAPVEYGLSAQDCSGAVSYLELLLHQWGLGSCWAGLVMLGARCVPEIRTLLGVSDDQALYGGLMVGYPVMRCQRIPSRRPLALRWV